MIVYYKKLIIDLWDYKITTVQKPKIKAYVENDHCLYWQPLLEQTCLTKQT